MNSYFGEQFITKLEEKIQAKEEEKNNMQAKSKVRILISWLNCKLWSLHFSHVSLFILL